MGRNRNEIMKPIGQQRRHTTTIALSNTPTVQSNDTIKTAADVALNFK